MQTNSKNYYQLMLTGLGLGLFALVMLMNHFHPHNEGIAALPRHYIYQKLAINSASDEQRPTFSYIGPLATPKVNAPAPKVEDPTTVKQDEQSPQLPIVNKVSDSPDTESDGTSQPQDSDNPHVDESNSQD